MRQARDLLYLLVHLGSNPNPGASFSGVFHQLLFCEHERISCGFIHLLDSNAPANRYSTAGHHIAPAFQAHGVGDCYGCPPRDPATCLPVRLPTSALLLVLSMYSGLALNLRTGLGKMQAGCASAFFFLLLAYFPLFA